MLQIAEAAESAPGPKEAPAAAAIRDCTPEDLPAVADIFRKTFRHRFGGRPAPLEPYLRQIFFEHPWQDPDLRSLVYVGPDGAVGGFIGVLPLRLACNGAPVRAAVLGTLMVDRPADNPTAGARLLRSCLAGAQDISISESANAVSRRMWLKLGGRTLAGYSMEWLRLLRPGGFGVAVLEDRVSLARLLRPLGALVDAVARRIRRNPLRLEAGEAAFTDSDVADAEIIEHILEFSKDYPVRPDWDRPTLAWFLDNAAGKARYGTLFRRVVYDGRREPVGCYLYYCRPRGIAFVLQILARPGMADSVVDNLLAHADRQGAVAVRGRVQPEFADSLLRRRSFFLHASSTVIHAKDEALLAAFRTNEALVTGLAGETWARLIGGTFL